MPVAVARIVADVRRIKGEVAAAGVVAVKGTATSEANFPNLAVSPNSLPAPCSTGKAISSVPHLTDARIGRRVPAICLAASLTRELIHVLEGVA